MLLATAGASAAAPPVHFAIDQDYQPQKQSVAEVAADFPLVRALGMHTLRTGIGWDDTNPERETFRWGYWSRVVARAARAGIAIRPYYAYTPSWAGRAYNAPPFDTADFARACGVMAESIGPLVPSLEIWNEPDNTAFWTGTPARYGTLLGACTDAIRAVMPTLPTVLGGLVYLDTPWLGRTGARAPGAYDVAAFHQYSETPWDKTRVEEVDAPRNFAPAYDRLSEHGRAAVWMDEGGATTDGRQGYSEATQAGWIRRTVASLLDQPGRPLGLIGLYQLRDPDPKLGHPIGDPVARRFFEHTGLFRVDGTPKLGAATTADLVRLFDGHRPEPVAARYEPSSGTPSTLFRLHSWRREDGTGLVMLWDRLATSCGTLRLPNEARAAFLHAPDGTVHPLHDLDGRRLRVPCIRSGDIPVLVEWRP